MNYWDVFNPHIPSLNYSESITGGRNFYSKPINAFYLPNVTCYTVVFIRFWT